MLDLLVPLSDINCNETHFSCNLFINCDFLLIAGRRDCKDFFVTVSNEFFSLLAVKSTIRN